MKASVTLACFILLIAIGTILLGFVAPLSVDAVSNDSITITQNKDSQTHDRNRVLASDFGTSLNRKFQNPLFERAVPVETIRVAPIVRLPQLQVKLIGTATEDDKLIAMLKTTKGEIKFKSVGESIGEPPAKLIEIKNDAVTFQYGDEKVVIDLNRS